MRSILLHVHDDDCMEARLRAALDLAWQCDGYLTCLQAAPYDLGNRGDFYGVGVAELAVEYEKHAALFRKVLEQRLEGEDVRWSWIQSKGPAVKLLTRHAPLNDILILGAQDPVGRADWPSALAMKLIFDVRAPMLLVPADGTGLQLDRPAIVAWNGSPEAAHALQAATPLLKRASDVRILICKESKKGDPFDMPPSGAARYLARHGIEAEIEVLPLTSKKAKAKAKALQDAAFANNAAYQVMGAYGHSRFSERVIGGVTRRMLTDPKMALLLCH